MNKKMRSRKTGKKEKKKEYMWQFNVDSLCAAVLPSYYEIKR